MTIITFQDGQFKTEKRGLVQYDYGQEIKIFGIDITNQDPTKMVFQFVKDGTQVNMFGQYNDDGSFSVMIPNQFLQTEGNILLYCFYETELEGETENCVVLDVLSREMYTPMDPEIYKDVIATILDDLAAMQEEIDNWTISEEQLQAIVDEVEASIDLNDYYDKQEVDNLLNDKASKTELQEEVVTLQNEIDAIDTSNFVSKTTFDDYKTSNDLAVHENTEDIADLETAMGNVYTKSQVDALIPDVSGLATKTEVTNGLADKADKATTYTKTEVDTALGNYYTKSQTYTQTEVNALINAISTLNIEVVNSLPSSNISTTTIYLVPSSDPQTSNTKDEYINLDGTSAGWELIGSTDVDLTNYVTTTSLATTLLDYVTNSSLSTTLADYITSSGLTTILADYVTATGLSNILRDYVTQLNLTTTLEDYATTINLSNLDSVTVKNVAVGNKETIGAVAVNSYVAGDYFLGSNGNYYKVTDTITASTTTITVGTNCTLTTISGEIKNLNTLMGDVNSLLAAI